VGTVAAEEAMTVELEALDHVGLVVSDMRGDYGVAWSLYLPDPDGYQVEITTYEPASA
jgi:catechol 2,3-dioxygenase-like lactoylglutathione lyase family enzyme